MPICRSTEARGVLVYNTMSLSVTISDSLKITGHRHKQHQKPQFYTEEVVFLRICQHREEGLQFITLTQYLPSSKFIYLFIYLLIFCKWNWMVTESSQFLIKFLRKSAFRFHWKQMKNWCDVYSQRTAVANAAVMTQTLWLLQSPSHTLLATAAADTV